ncbi:MAG TPA: hypothetical protein VFH29_05230 [Anaerolineales bacterium]|nr:hypothetical protein [Anaerolineales bacterium]
MVHRVGLFLILIGIGILVLFIASASEGVANYDYLFWCMLACIMGFFLRRRQPPAPPSDRFRLIRGLRRPRRGRKEQR